MLKITEIKVPEYEKVIEGIDTESGLHAFIAVHSSKLGPAVGGTRIQSYSNREAALEDVLRLSKAMTYKSSIAETGLGGGKAVIMADSKNEKLLLSYGEMLNSLQGLFLTAEDVGSTPEDMAIIKKVSPHVVALATDTSSGDPSRFTAWGVYRGLLAVATKLWGKPDLKNKVVAIQGLGSVGGKLAHTLFWAGADLIICDKDPDRVHHFSTLLGAKVIDPANFVKTKCDILAPCALGKIITHKNVNDLNCLAIAGAANNQLEDSKIGFELVKKGILYAPDFVINAGGIINAATEFDKEGYHPAAARDKTDKIYDTLMMIFEKAIAEKKPTSEVADELAEYKLLELIGRRIK